MEKRKEDQRSAAGGVAPGRHPAERRNSGARLVGAGRTRSRPSAAMQASLAAARQTVLRYLTGEELDSERMAAAMHELARHRPEELRRLRDGLVGRAAAARANIQRDCADVAECLDEYLAMGEAAASQMPEVQRHLRVCDQCAAHLLLLKGLAQHRPKWQALSREMGLQGQGRSRGKAR